MGLVCYFAVKIGHNKFLNLASGIIAGLFSYIIFCFIFRVSEMQQLWSWVMFKKVID
ncbi:MAG: hypothetical protein NTZ63_06770 [Candidatus Omnitrophica bacterium]|nr:hypothetical protein [Candidatus Omnitrophota bacterium]